jgi:hypothetical protein
VVIVPVFCVVPGKDVIVYLVTACPVELIGGINDITVLLVLNARASVIMGAFSGTPTWIPPPVSTTPAPNVIAIINP